MWDAHAIAEHSKQGLLAGHQIGLQQVLADGVAGLELEGFVYPCVLLYRGFFLDEDRAELAIPGEGCDCGPIHVLVVGAEPIEDLCNNSGIDGRVEFVGFHSGENWSGGESMRWVGGWQGRRRGKKVGVFSFQGIRSSWVGFSLAGVIGAMLLSGKRWVWCGGLGK